MPPSSRCYSASPRKQALYGSFEGVLLWVGCCALLAVGVHAAIGMLESRVVPEGWGGTGRVLSLGWEVAVDLLVVMPWPLHRKRAPLEQLFAAALVTALALAGACAVARLAQATLALGLGEQPAAAFLVRSAAPLVLVLLGATLLWRAAIFAARRKLPWAGALLATPLAVVALREAADLPSLFW